MADNTHNFVGTSSVPSDQWMMFERRVPLDHLEISVLSCTSLRLHVNNTNCCNIANCSKPRTFVEQEWFRSELWTRRVVNFDRL